METGNWADIGLIVFFIVMPVLAIFAGWAVRELSKKIGMNIDADTVNIIIKRAYSLVEKLYDNLYAKSKTLPRNEKIKLIYDKLVEYGKVLDLDEKSRKKLLVIAETAVDQKWADEDGDGLPDILEEKDLEEILDK